MEKHEKKRGNVGEAAGGDQRVDVSQIQERQGKSGKTEMTGGVNEGSAWKLFSLFNLSSHVNCLNL